MQIEYDPIGVAHSPYTEAMGTPIQPSRASQVRGTVEIFPQYVEGLSDLDGFSHIILLCHLHRSKPYQLQVIPFLDVVPRGVFSTRAPSRPNSIGLSTVRLCHIAGNRLEVEGMDLLEGTPILDIKPYFSEFDNRSGARFGWLETRQQQLDVADDRFEVTDS